LEKIGVSRSRNRREAHFRQGDPATHLFRIKEGAVGPGALRALFEQVLPAGSGVRQYHPR
jgi:hypothetical protein